jgi:hypothetical protein
VLTSQLLQTATGLSTDISATGHFFGGSVGTLSQTLDTAPSVSVGMSQDADVEARDVASVADEGTETEYLEPDPINKIPVMRTYVRLIGHMVRNIQGSRGQNGILPVRSESLSCLVILSSFPIICFLQTHAYRCLCSCRICSGMDGPNPP